MAGVNKVILVGNLGADPEARSLNNGGEVVNLRVATSENWTDKGSGERREKTEWHQVVIFNENLGRVAKNYLRKGSKVYLEGQLQTRKWQDQSGNDRYSTEIVLQRFRGELVLLDSREGAGGGRGGADLDEGTHRTLHGVRDRAGRGGGQRRTEQHERNGQREQEYGAQPHRAPFAGQTSTPVRTQPRTKGCAPPMDCIPTDVRGKPCRAGS